MAQTYPLDVVIRKVTSDTKAASPAEKVVIINPKTGKSLERRPLWRLNNLRYFLVSNTSDGGNVAECKISVFHLKEDDCSVAVSVSYLASCDAGNEHRLAESLFGTSHPGAVLEKLIRKWVTECSRGGLAQFIDNYFNKREEIHSRLSENAASQLGLNLKVKLSLELEKMLNPVQIGPAHFPVRVNDYDEEEDLRVKAELQVDGENKTRAVMSLARNTSLEEILRREIKSYFAEHVSLQLFYTELNKQSVKGNLIKRLDHVLKHEGRKIAYLSLESKALDSVQVFFPAKKGVQCEIQQYPKPIVVNSTVQMILQDVAKYKASNSPDLEDWLQKTLEREVPQLLFYKKYIDFLVNFQPMEADIKERLSKEAEAIGYKVEQLITVPDLEPIKWKDNFTIEASETFETRSANVEVKLHIIVTARIADLKKIESYLNRQQNVPKLMEEAVVSTTRQFLHKVEPERFYMRFSYTENAGEETVEKELRDEIKKRLTSEFHADVIDVIPKPVDTDLSTRLRKLQRTICPFEIEVSSIPSIEPIIFKGKFRVDSVDANGWAKFQLLNYEIDQIRENLEDSIEAKLGAYSNEILAYSDHDRLSKIEIVIRRLAQDFALEYFGLAIEILTVKREDTEIQKMAKEVQRKKIQGRFEIETEKIIDAVAASVSENKTKLAYLTALLEERQKAVAEGWTDEQIKEWDGRIEMAMASLPSASIPDIDILQQRYLPDSSQSTDIADFAGLKTRFDRMLGSGEEGNHQEQK